ncbi:MAG: hypothetical protein ACP6IY_14710 [Promethearchaeia archaeon]
MPWYDIESYFNKIRSNRFYQMIRARLKQKKLYNYIENLRLLKYRKITK